MIGIVVSTIACMVPLFWLFWAFAYNKGRSDGTLAERERWTRAFQGKGGIHG